MPGGIYRDNIGYVKAYQFWPGLDNPGVLTEFTEYRPGAVGYVKEQIDRKRFEWVKVYPGDWIVEMEITGWLTVYKDEMFSKLFQLVSGNYCREYPL